MRSALWAVILVMCAGAYAEGGEMKIKSPVFEDNGMIPSKYTCEGGDINPPLIMEDIPEGTQSLALIVDDPDAPMGTWVHWVVFNMDVVDTIEEDSVPGTLGSNDFGRKDYGGPCPPSGTHRYFFKLYALDGRLGLEEGAGKDDLERVMKDHIIEEARIIGLYKKRR